MVPIVYFQLGLMQKIQCSTNIKHFNIELNTEIKFKKQLLIVYHQEKEHVRMHKVGRSQSKITVQKSASQILKVSEETQQIFWTLHHWILLLKGSLFIFFTSIHFVIVKKSITAMIDLVFQGNVADTVTLSRTKGI